MVRIAKRWRPAAITLEPAKKRGQLILVEAQDLELELFVLQRAKLGREQLLIPARIFGNLVVGDHQRPALRLIQMRQHDHRHLDQAEALRREQPPVARQDHVARADEDRVCEPELDD